MERNKAIEYLKGKGIIEGQTKFSKEEEKEITTVIKEGKIYGDPYVEIQ